MYRFGDAAVILAVLVEKIRVKDDYPKDRLKPAKLSYKDINRNSHHRRSHVVLSLCQLSPSD